VDGGIGAQGCEAVTFLWERALESSLGENCEKDEIDLRSEACGEDASNVAKSPREEPASVPFLKPVPSMVLGEETLDESRPIENGSKSLSTVMLLCNAPELDGEGFFGLMVLMLVCLFLGSPLRVCLVPFLALCMSCLGENSEPFLASRTLDGLFVPLVPDPEAFQGCVFAFLKTSLSLISVVQSESASKESFPRNGSTSSRKLPKQSAVGSPKPSSPNTPSPCWLFPHPIFQPMWAGRRKVTGCASTMVAIETGGCACLQRQVAGKQ
jgi:hypothetical protein